METKASIRTKYKTLRNAMPENIVREDLSEYQYLGNLSESTKLFLLLSPWERSFFIAFF